MARMVRMLLASTVVALAACAGSAVDDSEGTTSTGGDGDAGTGAETGGGDGDGDGDGDGCEVDSLAVEIRENPDSTIAPFADVSATGVPAGASTSVRVWRGDEAVADRPATVPQDGTAWLWGLAADTDYEAEVVVACGTAEATSSRVAFRTGSLPAGVEVPTVVVDDPQRAHRGIVFFPQATGSRLVYVGVDHTGEVVWYRDLASFTQNAFAGDLQVRADGRLLVTERNRVHLIEPWGESVSALDLPFHHDVTTLPNGNFLAINDRDETITVPSLGGDVLVTVDGIVEVQPDGTVVQQWWASDHLDTQRYPSILSTNTTNSGGYDWTHANGLAWDAQRQQVIFSIRHQHWIIGIDWPAGTVAWTLGPDGDFPLSSGGLEEWFYAPHAPELQADGSLLLYDNGNERPSPDVYSRAVQIAFDPAGGDAVIGWQARIEPMTPSFGDADRMPSGHVLACAGGVPSMGPNPARILEIDGADVVWELHTRRTYRATYLDGF